MSITHQKNSLTESLEITPGNSDVASKFRFYRMEAESIGRKLKEANAVIERLTEEINFSRDSEKNLRNQLSSAQNRLIYLQQTLKKIISISEQQRKNDKIAQQIEKKVEKISEEIEHTREESRNLLKHVSNEVDLEKEIKNLKSIIGTKNRECDYMKMEVQTLKTEKKNMETASQQKLRSLEKEVEMLKQKEVDSKARYRETLMYYQQELEEKDQTIKFYEKERKAFLDDFELIKVSEIDSGDHNCVDGTISPPSPKRLSNGRDLKNLESHTENSNTTASRSSQSEEKFTRSFKKEEDQTSSKGPRKQKPQLEFLKPLQLSSQSTDSVKSGRKRRLFSTNSNYYTG